jgi:hypothetical protein
MTFQRTLMPPNTQVPGDRYRRHDEQCISPHILHDAVETVACGARRKGKARVSEDELTLAWSVTRRDAWRIRATARLAQREGERCAAPRRDGSVVASVASFAGLASGVAEESLDVLDDRTQHRLASTNCRRHHWQ